MQLGLKNHRINALIDKLKSYCEIYLTLTTVITKVTGGYSQSNDLPLKDFALPKFPSCLIDLLQNNYDVKT